jgi:hypothetical protein
MPFPANYQPNNTIEANDLVQAIGAFGIGAGYISDVDAQQKAGAIWGVGWGTRGYGQSAPTLAPPSVGDTVSGGVWTDLRQVLLAIAQHHNGNPAPATTLPPTTAFNFGATVQAHVPPNFDLPSQLTVSDNNRNAFASPAAALASCEIVSSVWTVTRDTDWGIGVSGITAVVDVSWTNEDAARYFFNSGGLINLNFAQPNTGNLKSANWANIFTNKVGTLSFGINSTTWTGTWPGSPVAVGYYQLTAAPVTIFNGLDIGDGAYTNNDMFVSANYIGALGPRGGRSNAIRFTIQLIDEVAGPGEQPVLAGTNVTFGYRRAVTYLSGIPFPGFTTATPF